MTYLIPCHLITTHTLPTLALLQPYPRLQELFNPLSRCIKKGDLAGFDEALEAGYDEFVKRRIYLTLERGRDIALRNLLRKVFIAGGFEEAKDGAAPVRRSRISVAEFTAAVSISSKEIICSDEVECLIANMVYKVCGVVPLKLPCCLPRLRFELYSLSKCGTINHKPRLTLVGLDERLHPPRSRYGSAE